MTASPEGSDSHKPVGYAPKLPACRAKMRPIMVESTALAERRMRVSLPQLLGVPAFFVWTRARRFTRSRSPPACRRLLPRRRSGTGPASASCAPAGEVGTSSAQVGVDFDRGQAIRSKRSPQQTGHKFQRMRPHIRPTWRDVNRERLWATENARMAECSTRCPISGLRASWGRALPYPPALRSNSS